MSRSQYFVALVALILAGLTGGALSGRLLQSPAQAKGAGGEKVVRTQSLEIVDQKGKARITLQVNPGDLPSLDLLDESQRPLLRLSLGSEGQPFLSLHARQESKGLWYLGIGPGGSPAMTIKDGLGRLRFLATLDKDEVAAFLPPDKAAQPPPEGALVLFDNKGKVLWLAPWP